MLTDLEWTARPIREPHQEVAQRVRASLSQTTGGSGSLGRLEELAIRLAGMRHAISPSVDPARIVLFGADHGIAPDAIGHLSHATTRTMLHAGLRGHTPTARMARQLDVDLEMVDVGIIAPSSATETPPVPPDHGRIRLFERAVACGTSDFRYGPAMTHAHLSQALKTGREAVNRAIQDGKRLLLAGDIGLAGTLSAGAVVSALLKAPPELLIGPGRHNLAPADFPRVAVLIQQGLDLHLPFHDTAMESLRRLGGYEMAALTGTFIACGQRGLPALVDGFVASTAALVAIFVHPSLQKWLFFAHRSAEPGQLLILRTLNVQPLIDLNMQWGEATGAAVALPILRLACSLCDEPASEDPA